MKFLTCAALVLLSSIAVHAQPDTTTVTVRHGSCTMAVTREGVQGMFAHQAVVVSKDGEQHTYRGPLLKNVLRAACSSVGEMDKHAMTAAAIKVIADDGFVAIIAGMELDSTFRAKPVLLAWERDGQALDAHYGPLQLIVPEDLRHSRNVRHVRSIEVLTP